jgi:hypothetical protein
VQHLVGVAQRRAAFAPLPAGRSKPDVVWLLELCGDPSWRPDVMQAFEWLANAGLANPHGYLDAAISACKGELPQVSWRQPADTRPPEVLPDEVEWQKTIVQAQRTQPFSFEPPVTQPMQPDRHPWDGCVYPVTFTEVAIGIGVFAACFTAAGAECRGMVEQAPWARRVASLNAPGARPFRHTIAEDDPAHFEWSHGVIGGPDGRPFGSTGTQATWADDRADALLRTLHLVAVMQPWWVWLEDVTAIAVAKGGRVWLVIQEIATRAGFAVRLRQD